MSYFDRQPTQPTWLSRDLESKLNGKDQALRCEYQPEAETSDHSVGMVGRYEDHILGVLKLAVATLIPRPHWKHHRIQPWEMEDMPTLVKAYCDELHSRAAFVKDVGLEQTMLGYFSEENNEHSLMDKYTQFRKSEDGYMTRLGKAVRPSMASSHLSNHQLGSAMAGLIVVSDACLPRQMYQARMLLGIDESDQQHLRYEMRSIRQARHNVLQIRDADPQYMQPPNFVTKCVEEVAEVALSWFLCLDLNVDDLDRLAASHQFTRSMRFILESIHVCEKADLFRHSTNTYTKDKPTRICVNPKCWGTNCWFSHDPVLRSKLLEGQHHFAKL